MEDAGCGVEGEVLVGGYPWRKPAGGGGPFDGEHMVCKGAAEDEFFRGREDFGGGGVGDCQGGGVKTGEFGDGFFLSLDALAVWPLRLAWCERFRGF